MPYIVFLNPKGRRDVWRRLIKYYGKTVLLLSGYPFIRVKYVDLANEECARPGVCILNHRSGSDAFFVAELPGKLVQVINDWPFKLPFFGFFAKLGKYYNIKTMPWSEFLQKAGEDINSDGNSVAGFPEGTRSGDNGLGQFHGILFRLAQEIQCPIFPVLILGTEKIPDLNFMMHPGTVRIYKMQPLMPEEFADWTAFKLKKHVRELMCEKIKELES